MDMKLYKAATAKAGYTQYQLARLLGMADSTLIRKVKRESLSLVEVKRIMDILQIDDPRPIFFPQKENGDDTSIEKGHQMNHVENYKSIAKWAKEIELLALLLAEMEKGAPR